MLFLLFFNIMVFQSYFVLLLLPFDLHLLFFFFLIIGVRIALRAKVNESSITGLRVVDSILSVGRGQRQLILGDRYTGKTTILCFSLSFFKRSFVSILFLFITICLKRSFVSRSLFSCSASLYFASLSLSCCYLLLSLLKWMLFFFYFLRLFLFLSSFKC